MAVVYWIIGIGVIAAFGFFGWAMTLPKEVSASRDAVIDAPIEVVFTRVTDVGNQQAWRSDVGRVDVADDGATWVEHTSQGIEIAFREEEKRPGFYAISFQSPQGFSGRWEGHFEKNGECTRVSITETIRTEGFFARVMARIFAPPGAHIDLYLNDLAQAIRQADEGVDCVKPT